RLSLIGPADVSFRFEKASRRGLSSSMSSLLSTRTDAIKSNRSPQDLRVSRPGLSSPTFFFSQAPPNFLSLVKKSSPQIDSLLEPLVQMSGAKAKEAFLSHLIAAHAEPFINALIRYMLSSDMISHGVKAEAAELRQVAREKLLVELPKIRYYMATHPIREVRGLEATITFRLSAQGMRRHIPPHQS